MPSETEKQRRFMGADLARKRAGKKTRTGMSEEQLEDFARKKKKPAVGKGEAKKKRKPRVGYGEGRPPTAGSSRPVRPFAPPDYAGAFGARRKRGMLDDDFGPPLGRGWRGDMAGTQPIPDEPVSRMGIGGARRVGRGEAMRDPLMDPMLSGTMTSSAMMPTAPVRPRPPVKRKRKPAATTKAKAKKKTETKRRGGY